jgi:transposase-like protein
MARPRRPNERPSYRAAPQIPPELTERFATVSAVIAKTMTVSDGARRLSIARPNFQSLVHKVQAAMLAAMTPQPTGPTPRSPTVVELERKVAALEKQNARLTEQLHTMDRLLGAAGEVIRGLRQPSGRSSTRSSRSSTRTSTAPDEDPEPALSTAMAMTEACRSSRLAAGALGVGASTLRRWRRHGRPGRRPSRQRAVPPGAAAEVRSLVRDLRGLAGAAALAKSVPAVSRRQAAALKQAELAALERERKAEAVRVEVTAPGAIRGFDAMHVDTTAGRRYVLAAGDASVPYRTSLAAVERYTGGAVAAALDRDFTEHGAPLVCRLDRAACHRTDEVLSVMQAHGVLVLHGPPRHPRYYGQLERQNREHRAWLASWPAIAPDALAAACEAMRNALNRLWRRPTLDWCPASAVWETRPALAVDRAALRDEVADRRARLVAHGTDDDLADRLAIEQALIARGLLKLDYTRRVLCG